MAVPLLPDLKLDPPIIRPLESSEGTPNDLSPYPDSLVLNPFRVPLKSAAAAARRAVQQAEATAEDQVSPSPMDTPLPLPELAMQASPVAKGPAATSE